MAENKYLTVGQTMEILNRSAKTVKRMMNDGTLPFETNPTDRRERLIERRVVEELRRKYPRRANHGPKRKREVI